jgi:short-chain fatty acids transporter
MLLSLVNWGLGLVGGAFFAREMGRAFVRRGAPLNYPLVGAAGYTGLLVWHGGLSGSAPLKVATQGAFDRAIPVSETLFSGINLAASLLALIIVPALLYALGKGDLREEDAADRFIKAEEGATPLSLDEAGPGEKRTLLGRLEASPLFALLLVLPLLFALGSLFIRKGGGALNLGTVIAIFLVAGLVAHLRPLSYAQAFGEGTRSAAGILLQFPIYFGILALARDSGLMAEVARAFADFSLALQASIPPEITGPLSTFASAGLLNLLVPSGGGQWVLQAPVVAELTQTLNLSPGRMVMAFSWGDQVTNMLQPFWALPLLSITGLKAKEVMGYTILAMVAGTMIFTGLLAFWP